jgi:predicted transposase/invertase (TIGR01784 family)
MDKKKPQKAPKKRISVKSDEFCKKALENQIAARQFLEAYLPADIRERVDLSVITIEKESYIDGHLRKQYSDIVYSVKDTTQDNTNDKAYIYILLEQQSTSDYWIALRLWKYALSLADRHRKGKAKLPLIVPMVLYNGSKAYKAPRNLWELFTDPQLAKQLMGGDYALVDLQAMADDDIIKKQHLGMMEFFLKHIHQRDMLALWEAFLTQFKQSIEIDRANGYIYIRLFLEYTGTKVKAEERPRLHRLLTDHLEQDGEKIMSTIADEYFEKGMEQGIQQGVERGIEKVAKELLRKGFTIEDISELTSLSVKEVTALKNTLH